MSFKLSRSQFLQVFAVMQSIKLINGHTSNGAAPRILWGSNNIDKAQFAPLLGLISETPLMQSLESLPSGCIAPILINPFVEGDIFPTSDLGLSQPMKLKILTLIAKGSLGQWMRISVWLSRTLFDLPISERIVWHRQVMLLLVSLSKGEIKSTVRINYSLLVSMGKW
ncbi:TPA: hypothetical protein ACNADR_004870 [Escherichia coli]